MKLSKITNYTLNNPKAPENLVRHAHKDALQSAIDQGYNDPANHPVVRSLAERASRLDELAHIRMTAEIAAEPIVPDPTDLGVEVTVDRTGLVLTPEEIAELQNA